MCGQCRSVLWQVVTISSPNLSTSWFSMKVTVSPTITWLFFFKTLYVPSGCSSLYPISVASSPLSSILFGSLLCMMHGVPHILRCLMLAWHPYLMLYGVCFPFLASLLFGHLFLINAAVWNAHSQYPLVFPAVLIITLTILNNVSIILSATPFWDCVYGQLKVWVMLFSAHQLLNASCVRSSLDSLSMCSIKTESLSEWMLRILYLPPSVRSACASFSSFKASDFLRQNPTHVHLVYPSTKTSA